MGGVWGDKAVGDVYTAALRYGWEPALVRVLGVGSDSLSKLWIASIRNDYSPVLQGRTPPKQVGQAVLTQSKQYGDLNVGPVVSPDGRFVAYFSQRGLFNIDLYLADSHTGKVIRQLASPTKDSRFDAISFINSAGTFSPNGDRFAFVAYADGDNEIEIVNVLSGKLEKTVHLKQVPAMTTLAWSPDGQRIAVSGQHGGIGDLFVYTLATGDVQQLTDDRYAELHPAWSPDGKSITFATDRGPGTNFDSLTHAQMRIAVMDVATKKIRLLPLFNTGKAINPQYSTDGAFIYFVSDQDGVPDLYRVELATEKIWRVTNVTTGVSGITELSPAISVSGHGRVMFSVFESQGNSVYALDSAQALGEPIDVSTDSTAALAAQLPPLNAAFKGLVTAYLNDPITGLPTETQFTYGPFKSAFRLDAIGSPQIGVGTGQFGTVAAGGTSLFFGDILGNQQLALAASIYGQLSDFGFQTQYLNQSHRWNWGGGFAHIPYITGFTTVSDAGGGLLSYNQYIQRVFIDQVQVGTQYPFNPGLRFEIGGGYTHYRVHDTGAELRSTDGINFGPVTQRDTTSPPGLSLLEALTAFVHDNSYFGYTSPIAGIAVARGSRPDDRRPDLHIAARRLSPLLLRAAIHLRDAQALLRPLRQGRREPSSLAALRGLADADSRVRYGQLQRH